MFTNLKKRFQKSPREHVSPYIPDNQRVYCVGDIHGRADLLEGLHEKIISDSSSYCGNKTVVYLGDYVDRGHQSRQVVEILLSRPLQDFEHIFLKGNHEWAMMDFIENPQAAAAWISFGGREALNSYGITLAHIPSMDEVIELGRKLDDALPNDHRVFLYICRDSWQCGSYYFVHAGIRPGTALEHQVIEDKLWIRDEFLQSNRNHGSIIVHGHTITPEPEFLPNRIGIDTGAFSTGVLTCLVLEGDQQRILQT